MARFNEVDEGSLEGVSAEMPDGYVAVACFDEATVAHEVGLAVLAMGEGYWLVPMDGRLTMCVSEGRSARIIEELEYMEQIRARSSGVGTMWRTGDLEPAHFGLMP